MQKPVPEEFCDLCEAFIRDVLSQNYGNRWETEGSEVVFTHGKNQDIIKWRDNGCKLCGSVSYMLGPNETMYEPLLAPLQFRVHLNDPTRFVALIDRIFEDGDQKKCFEELEFYQIDPEAIDSVSILESEKLWRKRLISPQKLPLKYGLAAHIDSNASFGPARAWLWHCENNHPTCLAIQEATLPTRVVDVGPADGSEEPHLFVSQKVKGRYATLSHRWGDTPILKTTMDNLQAHQSMISMSSLPATFRDAIIVTRKLGL